MVNASVVYDSAISEDWCGEEVHRADSKGADTGYSSGMFSQNVPTAWLRQSP